MKKEEWCVLNDVMSSYRSRLQQNKKDESSPLNCGEVDRTNRNDANRDERRHVDIIYGSALHCTVVLCSALCAVFWSDLVCAASYEGSTRRMGFRV